MPPRLPHLEFIFRLDCEMAPAEENQEIGAPFNGTQIRKILPIAGGTVKGPHMSGTIVSMCGADWGWTTIGTGFIRLDARYTLKTTDGHFVYVRSKGIFSPLSEELLSGTPHTDVSQSECDWFTKFHFEAGPGPYNWMNSSFCIGILTMEEGRIVIHAYRLTNEPNQPARGLEAQGMTMP